MFDKLIITILDVTLPDALMRIASSISAFVPVWLDRTTSFFFRIGLRDTLYDMRLGILGVNKNLVAALTGSSQFQQP